MMYYFLKDGYGLVNRSCLIDRQLPVNTGSKVLFLFIFEEKCRGIIFMNERILIGILL